MTSSSDKFFGITSDILSIVVLGIPYSVKMDTFSGTKPTKRSQGIFLLAGF